MKSFLLTVPHTTLPHCIRLNPATLHLSITEEVPFDSLTLRDHLLTGPNDLQANPLSNTDLSWFTGGYYIKGAVLGKPLPLLLMLRQHLYVRLL